MGGREASFSGLVGEHTIITLQVGLYLYEETREYLLLASVFLRCIELDVFGLELFVGFVDGHLHLCIVFFELVNLFF